MPSVQGLGGRPGGGMPPGGNMSARGGMPKARGGDPGGLMSSGGPEMGVSDMEERMKAFEATKTWEEIRLAYNGE